jgi:hypothetical protein
MKNYKLYITGFGSVPNAVMTVGVEPQISFLLESNNTDYQEYLKWLEEGNEPLPADE